MTLNVAVGAFDVTTATCCSQFVNCCGDSSFIVSPSAYLCPVGQSMQCTASATNCDGTTVYPTPSWWSSNTAIATITNGGMMTGVAPGQVMITANFTSAPAQTGTFCAPHICVTQTASASSPEPVSPGIFLGGCSGSEIAGTTQNAVVGRQIVLCGSYNLPSGVSVTSQSWSVGGTTEGGFTVASDYSSGGYTAATFNQTSTTFYWLAPGNALQVKFTLNLNNGSSPSATSGRAGCQSPASTLICD